ncbi:hypothetical protein Tco_0491702 [Tanacetum coccineum]
MARDLALAWLRTFYSLILAPPNRTDEQILPHIRWVPIGKSNCYLDAEKSQSNPIYKIAVHILKQTNFFRAFTASSTIPAIYIQQFWDTICYDRITGGYKCQLDEQWILLSTLSRSGLSKKTSNILSIVHKFHPRPESPLHLPTEEPILGYLKFSAKGTKREVFGMPILNELITDDIRGADYYDAYLEKVAKHQRYLAGEEVSDPDSPAPKPAKSTKPKVTKQAKPVAPKAATKKPQPAPTKPKEKKRKQLVDEFVDEGIPLTEPGFGDLEADTQRAIEESLKDAHGAPQGPLPPVVFRETDTGKFQPLPEVEGKGKEKVGAEQAAQEMPPVVKSGDQDKGQAGPDPGIQDKGQAEPNPDDVAESNLYQLLVSCWTNLEHKMLRTLTLTSQPQPGKMDEEFTTTAYPNVQENIKLTVDEPVIPEEPASSTGTLSSLQHLAKDFSFGDQFFNDKPSEADNEKTTADTEAESMTRFSQCSSATTTTATTTATTTTTITTLLLPPQPQQGSSDPTLLKHIRELEQHITDLVDANQALEEILDTHGSRLYMLENQDIPNQVRKAMDEIVTDVVDWAMQGTTQGML